MTQDDAMRYLMRKRDFERKAEQVRAEDRLNLLRAIRNAVAIMVPAWLLMLYACNR